MPKPRVRACITFDFDAISGWMDEENPLPNPLSRGEFGGRVATPRLLDLLDKYGIKSSWYIPGHTADTFPDVVRDIVNRGHEVGHHGYLHETPAGIGSREEEVRIIERGAAALERITGKPITGYRSPSWNVSEHTLEILHEMDYDYDSSLMGDDFRLSYVRLGDKPNIRSAYEFGKPVNLVEVPIAWELDDWQWFEYAPPWSEGMFPPTRVEAMWLGEFDYAYEYEPGAVYTLTMHPQVIGRGARIAMLERVLRHIRSHADVEFRTVAEVVAEFRVDTPFPG